MKQIKKETIMKQNWEKEIRIILEEQVANYVGLFDEATCRSEIQDLIKQVKQDKDKEYADFSERMNKALFEAGKQARQEERERILKALPKEKDEREGDVNDVKGLIKWGSRIGFNACLKQIKDILDKI